MSKFASPFSVPGSEIKGVINEKTVRQYMVKKVGLIPPTIIIGDTKETPFERISTLTSSFKIRACVERWRDGASWEDTGVYEITMNIIEKSGEPFGGCETIDDVVERYRNLDRLYQAVRLGEPLRSSVANDAIIHIGPGGALYFGGGAHHRTAIAYILNANIPVRLCLVHEKSRGMITDLISENIPMAS